MTRNILFYLLTMPILDVCNMHHRVFFSITFTLRSVCLVHLLLLSAIECAMSYFVFAIYFIVSRSFIFFFSSIDCMPFTYAVKLQVIWIQFIHFLFHCAVFSSLLFIVTNNVANTSLLLIFFFSLLLDHLSKTNASVSALWKTIHRPHIFLQKQSRLNAIRWLQKWESIFELSTFHPSYVWMSCVLTVTSWCRNDCPVVSKKRILFWMLQKIVVHSSNCHSFHWIRLQFLQIFHLNCGYPHTDSSNRFPWFNWFNEIFNEFENRSFEWLKSL